MAGSTHETSDDPLAEAMAAPITASATAVWYQSIGKAVCPRDGFLREVTQEVKPLGELGRVSVGGCPLCKQYQDNVIASLPPDAPVSAT